MKDYRSRSTQGDDLSSNVDQSAPQGEGAERETSNGEVMMTMAEQGVAQGGSPADATPVLDAAATDIDEDQTGSWFSRWLGWDQTQAQGTTELTEQGASASGGLTHEAVDGTKSAMSGQGSIDADGTLSASGQASRGFTARTEEAPDSWEQRSSQTEAQAAWSNEGGATGSVVQSSERISHYQGHEVTTQSARGLSHDGERLTASASSSTKIDDDGVVRETGGSGEVSFDEEHGFATSGQYAQVVSDGEDYRTSRAIQGSVDHEQARGAMSTSARYEDLEGRMVEQSSEVSAGWNYEEGLMFGMSRESSWELDGSEGQRTAAMSYENGQLGAQRTVQESLKGEDGSANTRSSSYHASAGAQGMSVAGSGAQGYSNDGIEGYSELDGQVAWTPEDGLDVSATTRRGLEDGEEYHDRLQAGVSYSEGVLAGSAATEVRYTDAQGVVHDVSRGGTASYGPDGVAVGVQESQMSIDDGVGSGTSSRGQLELGPDGPTVTAGRGRVTSLGEDYRDEREMSMSVGPDGFGVGMSDTTTSKDVDGRTHRESSSGGVQLSGDAVTAQGARSTSVENADGSSDSSSVQGSISSDGTMAGGYATQRKDSDGNVTGGTAVNGQVRVSENEIGAGFGVTQQFKEGRSVSGGGNFVYQLAEPAEKGGVWVVEYRQAISANVGGGVSGEFGEAGLTPQDRRQGQASASASLAGQVVSGGSRTFGSEDEARAWYERPDIGLMEGPTTDIEEILSMQAGSSQMTMMSGELGVNGSVSHGFLSLDAGGKIGASHGLTVTRGNDQMVYVRVDDATSLAGSLGISTVGLGLSASSAIEDFQGTTFSFDLSQESAQTAYVDFVGSGTVPAENTAGVVKKSETTGTTRTDTMGVTMGGMSMSDVSSLTESTTTDDQGNVVERARGARGFSAIWERFGLTAAEDHALEVTDVNRAERYLHHTSDVNHSSANGAHAGLARAAGVLGASNTAQGESSGRWTVETAFPPQAMDDFIAAVHSGEVNPHDGLIIGNSGRRMIEDVRAARGDIDEERRIVATFVRNEGHRAIESIRQNVGGDETYLKLEDNETFRGVEWYAEFEHRYRALEALSESDDYDAEAAFREVEELSRTEHARLRDLQDFSKYPDLPNSLRRVELRRVEENIRRLHALEAIIGMAVVDAGGGQAILAPGTIESDLGNFAEAYDAARDANRSMETTYSRARDRRVVHENQGGRKNLGSSGIAGFFAAEEYESYTRIDTTWSTAELHRVEGTKNEDTARSFSRTSVSDAEASIEFWLHAADNYVAAERSFTSILGAYRDIESRHRDKPGYWR
ncbi:MAG: hypothetical protein EA397_10285 [Deltaproteobacteria bacterium]|nr:MAG: hypothetical protein EA397_10285 [Deltaproteobacteria bacterium]